jgi:hypothetical protein
MAPLFVFTLVISMSTYSSFLNLLSAGAALLTVRQTSVGDGNFRFIYLVNELLIAPYQFDLIVFKNLE